MRPLEGAPTLPRDIKLLLTGMSDRWAFQFGLIDTDLPFRKAREVFRVDQIMQELELDPNFPASLRRALSERVERARAELNQK